MKSLQNIDGAAHHIMFKEQAFIKFTIPTKAKELTERLINSLTEISKWLLKPEADKFLVLLRQEENAIESLMNRALEVKKDMLLCEDLYHLVHVKPGATFDANTMSAEMDHPDTSSDLMKVPLTVKLCLSPGVLPQHSQPHSPNDNAGILSD